MKKHLGSILLLIIAPLFYTSCDKSEKDPIPLQADAGEDFSAELNTTVTLDGSNSTGEPGFVLVWLLAGSTTNLTEQQINFQNTNSANPTFIPPKNGEYYFTLRVMRDGLINEDQVIVTVSGVLTMPSTITSNFVLTDVEVDPTKPDYVINNIVTIQEGIVNAETGSNSVRIEFGENGGLVVAGGGVNMTGVTLTSANGWKGIHLTGGSFQTGPLTRIEKAGKSAFTGVPEAASIVYDNGSLLMENAVFSGSLGAYDLLIRKESTFTNTIMSNTFALPKPIKLPVQHVAKIQGNFMPTGYDHIVVTTPGASTAVGGNIIFYGGTRYYIDGDLTVTGAIFEIGQMGTIAEIFMKPGTGLLATSGSLSNSGSGGSVVFDGLDGAPWKGIALGAGASIFVSKLEIKNAGSDVFNTGSFTSSAKASIYFASLNNTGTLANSKITNSQGYGIYIESFSHHVIVSNTIFTNTALPAISAHISQVHDVFFSNNPAVHTNTYTLDPTVAAVEARSPNPNSYRPNNTWPNLGGNNFYQIKGNVVVGGVWTLVPGAKIKFQAGKSLNVTGKIVAVGTAVAPIIFDSEAGTPGTWAGIMIESNFEIAYCHIKNGGELLLLKNGITPASELANIVFSYSGVSSAIFQNNTITGSAGYGVVVEAGSQNPSPASPANANTFSNNQTADVIIK